MTVEVTRWHSSIKTDDDVWGFRVYLGTQAPYAVAFLRGHHAGVGAPLAQCKADAIAAVERWRDGIR